MYSLLSIVELVVDGEEDEGEEDAEEADRQEREVQTLPPGTVISHHVV